MFFIKFFFSLVYYLINIKNTEKSKEISCVKYEFNTLKYFLLKNPRNLQKKIKICPFVNKMTQKCIKFIEYIKMFIMCHLIFLCILRYGFIVFWYGMNIKKFWSCKFIGWEILNRVDLYKKLLFFFLTKYGSFNF